MKTCRNNSSRQTPTLLIGISNGRPSGCEKELAIVPGASHLFEEPGTLEQAAHHAVHWFSRWLSRAAQQDPRAAG